MTPGITPLGIRDLRGAFGRRSLGIVFASAPSGVLPLARVETRDAVG